MRGVLILSFAQLIHQMLQLGRESGSLGAKILPEPFADRIANGSAGRVIDLVKGLDCPAVHSEFRAA
jgi:hypothetical protein